MKTWVMAIGMLLCGAAAMSAQQKSAAAKPAASSPKIEAVNFSSAVNEHYYALREKKLGAFTCDVKPDWTTMPAAMMELVNAAGRAPLEMTRLRLTVDAVNGLSFAHEYPKGTAAEKTATYDEFLGWYTNVLQGFFLTWGAKSMNGPMGDKFLASSVETAAAGSRVHIDEPGQQIVISVTKENVVTEVATHGANFEIDEHPVYAASAEGLLLTGMDAVNTNKVAKESTHVKYDLDYQRAGGLEVPHRVHLAVNDNVNLRFALEGCTVRRGAEAELPAAPVPVGKR